MDIVNSFAIIVLAAFVHASFQLSVSVLTLLSGHSIGARQSHAKLLRTTTSFVMGAGFMTVLLLLSISLLLLNAFNGNTPQFVWAAACGLLVGVAISVWLFYFRREKGTTLWVPRSFADYLTNRTKSTKSSSEAFGLGLSSVIGELLFIIAPLSISALVIAQLPTSLIPIGICLYAAMSMLPLIIIWVWIGSGHTLFAVQKWRESNKVFLQFIAGASLIVLSIFVYVTEIICNTVGGI